MVGRRVRIAAPLALLAAVVAAGGDAAAGGAAAGPAVGTIPRTPEFVRDVNDAIDRGVAWLRSVQQADGSFPPNPAFPCATTALAYQTLRVCGVAREDPAAAKAWTSMQRDYRKADLRTYSAALLLMAIAEHGDRDPAARDEHDVRLPAPDRNWAAQVATFLADAQTPDGCWSYGYVGTRGANYDHSNTQYALLGLKSAARCGIAVDAKVWKRSLEHFLTAQDAKGPPVPRNPAVREAARDEREAHGKTSDAGGVTDHARGWDYVAGRREAYASMTAGGVSSVVICRSELAGKAAFTQKLDADSEKSVWDGLAWLGTRWMPQSRLDFGGIPPDAAARLRQVVGTRVANGYEYYGVERAGVLAGVERMAGLDWYGEGAADVLRTFAADGGVRWGAGGGAPGDNPAIRASRVVETCFALLFLKRGTIPVARGAVTQPADDSDIRFDVAAGLQGRDFEDFLDLALGRWRRSKDEDARARIFDGVTAIGPRIVEPLLRRLDATDADERSAADALLRRATGREFGFDGAAAREAREDAAVRWQAWWFSASGTLRYDAATKRLTDARR